MNGTFEMKMVNPNPLLVYVSDMWGEIEERLVRITIMSDDMINGN
jgi:hypothetical protein